MSVEGSNQPRVGPGPHTLVLLLAWWLFPGEAECAHVPMWKQVQRALDVEHMVEFKFWYKIRAGVSN